MKNKIIVALMFILFCMSQAINSQILDSENKYTFVLKDGVTVVLYGGAAVYSPESNNPTRSKDYFYLPCNLRLSKNKDGTPQFLFLKYTSEDTDIVKNIQGGLFHVLMEFGLTSEQVKEATMLLRAKVNDAEIKGVVDVDQDGDNSVRIISGVIGNSSRTKTMIVSGKAPIFPGNKIAVAADLDEKGAQLFAATLERASSIADFSITLSYTYNIQMPAVNGYIYEDYSKLDSLGIIDSLSYRKDDTTDQGKKYDDKAANALAGAIFAGPIGGLIGWFTGGDDTQAITYDQMKKVVQYFEENDIIKLHFEENITDERTEKIREVFFQYFLNNFTRKEPKAMPIDPNSIEKVEIPELGLGDSYTFNSSFLEVVMEKRKKILNLNYSLSVKRSFQLTENLATWYKGVRDNPNCIGTINLNDPFFQYRDVNLILDLDAEEMFGKELNFITVNLRKNRSVEGANDFQRDVVFDKKYFEANGNRATITYSKGQDDSPELYEYKIQYSLRGGNVFPLDTTWAIGSWGGLTLSPPVAPTPVKFEADIDDLKLNGIKNVTLQLRYKKFGKEVNTNLNIISSEGKPITDRLIFQDKDTQGFVYRLVFFHKDFGTLAMPWESKISAGYVYAVIPDELKNRNKEFINIAIDAGKALIDISSNKEEVEKGNQILDKFREIMIEN